MTYLTTLKPVLVFALLAAVAGQATHFKTAQPAARQEAGALDASEQEVRCPVDQARTEITTPLPPSWWNTAQIGKLAGVAIEVIGGQKTLMCRYWAYGIQVSVMRKLPEGTRECRAVEDHFVCRIETPQPAGPPPASRQEVRCPVDQTRTEITTPLPDSWWNTPQLGRLTGVRIDVIGGQKTLVCRYSAYGTQVSIMRRFPEGVHECKALEDHFVCE